jgi:hypothetical protein
VSDIRECRKCGAEIEREGDLWVDIRSGDDGGTYDICPWGFGGNHEPRRTR